MNFSENIKTPMPVCPRKMTSMIEIHRQRFSRLNQKLKQRPVLNLHQPHSMYPIILPQASRPQPRQQARSKQQIQTHLPPTRRPNTAQKKNQPEPTTQSNQEYITLTNLSKILHVLHTQDKINDHSETITNASASTSNSTKQRFQQHLQETATRWWKPIRSSDSHPQSSTIHTSEISVSDENHQSQKNVPLLTIVPNSARKMNIPSTNANQHSIYDDSETFTEITTTNLLTSFVLPTKTLNVEHTRQEPLIMQARGMRVQPSDHRYLINQKNMNFFQQQRLIRQT